MIGKLFRSKSAAAAVPDGMRVYAVGDIHGCDILLNRLLDSISAESPGGASHFIFLGDYVDRGAGSKAVIDRLLRLRQECPDAVFLKGNHEQAMLDFLSDPSRNEEWLHWGGDKTLESYGVADIWKKNADMLAGELADRLPVSHREFLTTLDLWTVVGDYVFVHAGFKPGIPLDNQKEEDCLWIRGEFHNAAADARPDKIVVHGHHPVRKPLDAGWRIDVDTGAVWSDALTAVVLEGTARRFISTGKF